LNDFNNDFFPVVFHGINRSLLGDCWVAGFNRIRTPSRMWKWMTISLMNFLPNDVHTIIAGEKGLLVLNGGEYMCLPRQEFWNVDWPSQPITVVVNPLLRTFQLLPPMQHEKYAQEFKIAKLVVEEHKGRNKSFYTLYMVGERSGTYIEGTVTCNYEGSLVQNLPSQIRIT
jgi:hypothetical protein